MRPVIWYRDGVMSLEELKSAQNFFHCYSSRVLIPQNSFVIGRYSLAPSYKEAITDINNLKCIPINTYRQHLYILDIPSWSLDLEGLTPKTYSTLEELPESGPFILKGSYNSRKDQWERMMFASNKKEAIEVYLRLKNDSLFSNQDIYVRDYVPLERLTTGLNGLPISTEFRFFIYKGKILAGGFYWSTHVDDLSYIPKISEVPESFLHKVIDIVSQHVDFYVIDVAKAANGEWVVIELNDGCCSGLSEIEPNTLYEKLAENFS